MRTSQGRAISIPRVLLATLGLVATGFVVGGLCAGVTMVILATLAGEWRELLRPGFWILSGVIGGSIGAVAAPVLAWLCLRHVPLGVAILQTAIGTILGAVAGSVLAINPVTSALVGFTVAGLRLALATRRSRALHSPRP
jgi:hypothetical protein